MLREAIKKILPMTMIKSLVNYKILSFNLGQWRSMRANMSVDSANNPMPWYTYPAFEFLTQFDISDKVVFEFGSGNSSRYWAERAKELFSVEDNLRWFNIVSRNKCHNQHISFFEEKEGYVSHILALNRKFDVIIIDGKYRIECAENAVRCLNDGGIIILDNSDWFPKTSQFLRSSDLIEIDFSGFGPINRYAWITSIYLSRNFRFRTLSSTQPVHCLGGRKQHME